MASAEFQGQQFASSHEATCAALFNKYGWNWKPQPRTIRGWLPDFLLKGDVSVFVECKGSLKWDDVPLFITELQRFEDAVSGSLAEVLLIPDSPRREENSRGYTTNILGFLFDGNYWSYAELGRWSGKVGFCHSGNSWKDRISGKDVKRSSGDGQPPDIETDWRFAKNMAEGKRMSFFKAFSGSDVVGWEPSSRD